MSDQIYEEEREALRKIRDVYEQAVVKNQLDLIKPHLANGFSIVTFTDREFTRFEDFKARWQQTRDEMLGASGSFKVTLNPEPADFRGNTAYCRGNSENAIVDRNGRKFTFTSHWTAVCEKVDGSWKIVRAHNSLEPFNNPVLKHGIKNTVVKVAAGALAVGVILGFLINYFI